jgi:hypothetical protein
LYFLFIFYYVSGQEDVYERIVEKAWHSLDLKNFVDNLYYDRNFCLLYGIEFVVVCMFIVAVLVPAKKSAKDLKEIEIRKEKDMEAEKLSASVGSNDFC